MLGLAIPYTWELVEFKDQRKAVNKGVYGSYWIVQCGVPMVLCIGL